MADKRQYKHILPFHEDARAADQFGWLPLSVVDPSRESKAKWKDAYIPQTDDEKRRSDTSQYLPGLGMSEFHAGLCENIVKYWSLPGSHIVDPFMGRATRAVVSTTLNRTYEGYEISPITHKRVTEHMNTLGMSAQLHLADGTQLEHTVDESADLVMTCPPYWNIEKYEDVDGQLSSTESYDEFMQMITSCGKNIARVLKPGAFCVWVCADFRDWSGKNKFYPFHADTLNTFTTDAGLIFHDIVIIKNQSPFAALQAGKVAAKRYTSKIHEYILVFRKAGEYTVPSHCTMNSVNDNAEQFFDF
jgi:DNA modification methylase